MAGMTTNELIKLVLEHDAEATPGPWDAEGQGGIQMDGHRDFYQISSPAVYRVCWGFPRSDNGYANARLTAYYRTAAPLLARKLQRALEALRAASNNHFSAPLPDDFDETQTLSLPVYGPFDAVLGEIEEMG